MSLFQKVKTKMEIKYKHPTTRHSQICLLSKEKESKIKTFEITNKFSEINFSSPSTTSPFFFVLFYCSNGRWNGKENEDEEDFYLLPVPHYFYHCFMQIENNQNKTTNFFFACLFDEEMQNRARGKKDWTYQAIRKCVWERN